MVKTSILWQFFMAISLTHVTGFIPAVPFLCGEKAPDEGVNTAQITITNDDNMPEDLIIYLQTQQCYKCDLISTIAVRQQCNISVDSRWPMRVEVRVLNLRDGTIANASGNMQ
ncbi:hypothetical protein Btru_075458 [Bulinus truncatus]|nr:hypothetical protein Btru_075458 [Bulinus truncatus]